jgi:NADPH:quinone reductase
MKAIIFDEIGRTDLPVPEIGDNYAPFKMVSASINPGDLLFIRNL